MVLLFSVVLLTWNGTWFTFIVCGLTLVNVYYVVEWCEFFCFFSWIFSWPPNWYRDNSFHCCLTLVTTYTICSCNSLSLSSLEWFIYFLLFLVTKWISTLRTVWLVLARVHLTYAKCRICDCNFVSFAEFNLIGLNLHADSFMLNMNLIYINWIYYNIIFVVISWASALRCRWIRFLFCVFVFRFLNLHCETVHQLGTNN